MVVDGRPRSELCKRAPVHHDSKSRPMYGQAEAALGVLHWV